MTSTQPLISDLEGYSVAPCLNQPAKKVISGTIIAFVATVVIVLFVGVYVGLSALGIGKNSSGVEVDSAKLENTRSPLEPEQAAYMRFEAAHGRQGSVLMSRQDAVATSLDLSDILLQSIAGLADTAADSDISSDTKATINLSVQDILSFVEELKDGLKEELGNASEVTMEEVFPNVHRTMQDKETAATVSRVWSAFINDFGVSLGASKAESQPEPTEGGKSILERLADAAGWRDSDTATREHQGLSQK